MADVFWQLPPASFNKIKFPVTKVSVKCGTRHHVHEYPKAPGGAPEKLGRKLYTIQMHAIFDVGLLPPWDENLWPSALGELFNLFEKQKTCDLMIPTVGIVECFCTNWSKEMEPKGHRSGERVELEFLEDQSAAYLFEGLLTVRTYNFTSQVQRLADKAAASGRPGLFASALAALRQMQTMVDRAEMYTNVVAAQVAQVVAAFEALVDNPFFDIIANIDVYQETLAAWEQAQRIQADLMFQQQNPLVPYTTPRDGMTVTDISMDKYGTVDQASIIMRMNALDNPLYVPRDTRLLVYANALPA